MPVVVGQRAPDFSLTDTSGDTWRLSEHLSEGPTVLVFNRGFT
ncbi:MAG: redoxin domain-containing protein [Chloroflexi bacterium]|nr:redoxin domain-containing protein [Chloroflexota bacterium]